MEMPSILVVEDDGIIGQHLRNTLKKLGYNVQAVINNGPDAIRAAADGHPDLILMDIVLEGEMNGVAAAEQIGKVSDIPVVYLTAYADNEVLQQAKITNPFGYLLKPFEERNLHATLEMALQKHLFERRLRESEERYSAIVKQSADGVVLVDPESCQILEVNPAFLRLTGLSSEDIVPNTILDLVDQHNGISDANFSHVLERLTAEGHLSMGEQAYVRKDGAQLFLEINLSLITYEQRQIICAVVSDITAQNLAELDRARQTRQLEALYETSLEINAQRDSKTLLDAILSRASELMGLSRSSLYLLSQDEQRVELVLNHNMPESFVGSSLLIGEGLAGRVVQSGQPLMVEDYRSWEGRAGIYDESPAKRVLGLPLKASRRRLSQTGALGASTEKTFGAIIIVDNLQTGPFSPEEIRLANMFAEQAAIAVENSRLYEAAKRELVERKRAEVALLNLYSNLETQVEARTAELAGVNLRFQETQKQQKALLDSIPDMAWLKDDKGRFIAVNQPFSDNYGIGIVDIIGKTDFEIGPKDLAEGYRADDQDVMQKRQPKRVDELMINLRGGRIWVETIKVPILDDFGEVIGTAGIARDISERRESEAILHRSHDELERLVKERTIELENLNDQLRQDIVERQWIEEALRESEQRYRSLFVTAQRQAQELSLLDRVRNALTLKLDLPEIFSTVIETFAETFGYTQISVYLVDGDELRLEKQVGYSFCFQRIPLSRGICGRVARSGQPLLVKDVRIDPDFIGAIEGVVSEVCVPLMDHDQVFGILNVESTRGVALDESDLRLMSALSEQISIAISENRLDRQIRESEERYRSFVQNFQGIAFGGSLDFKPTFMNGATEEITGYTESDFLEGNVSWYQIIQSEDLAQVNTAIEEMLASPSRSGECEYRLVRKDGQVRWVHELFQRVKDVLGGPDLTQGTIYDITERKRAEKVQNAIYQISQAAFATVNLEDLFALIHGILGELMSVENFFIALYDEHTDQVSFPYFVDAQEETPPPQRPGKGLTEYVLRTGQPLLAQPEMFQKLIELGEVVQIGPPSLDWLGVPLKVKDRTIGVMAVQTYIEGVRFDERELHILTFVSTQVAMVIERKRTEEALRWNEELYRTLVENIPVGVYRTRPGPKGEFMMANPAFLKLLGFNSEDELKRYTPADLWVESDRRQAFSERLLTNGSIDGTEIKLKKRDGTTLWGLVRARVVKDTESGGDNYFDCSIEDITERKQRERELTSAYEATLEGWARALELRDRETEGHAKRVSEVTVKLARFIGMSQDEITHVRRGALLHDIGKMGIPDSILFKTGPLFDEELQTMRLHPIYAYEMLLPIKFLRPALNIPYCHHEKWDGSGYPRGLKGEQIPLEARIFAIIDVWDSLSFDRPYRPAWPKDKVIAYLQQQSGKYFDPQVVTAFINMGL
jgi:PAS domain S-box-containing protein